MHAISLAWSFLVFLLDIQLKHIYSGRSTISLSWKVDFFFSKFFNNLISVQNHESIFLKLVLEIQTRIDFIIILVLRQAACFKPKTTKDGRTSNPRAKPSTQSKQILITSIDEILSITAYPPYIFKIIIDEQVGRITVVCLLPSPAMSNSHCFSFYVFFQFFFGMVWVQIMILYIL